MHFRKPLDRQILDADEGIRDTLDHLLAHAACSASVAQTKVVKTD